MMHLAATSGNVKILETLLEEGADKDIVDRWGKTPLHKAVESGNVQALVLLSRQGASLKVADPAGELCRAADKEDTVQVRQ
jgi:ankyrin repeat protein